MINNDAPSTMANIKYHAKPDDVCGANVPLPPPPSDEGHVPDAIHELSAVAVIFGLPLRIGMIQFRLGGTDT